MIATVPDPRTQLPFTFDRAAEAIQQAAATNGYNYDSSWMPWETEKEQYLFVDDEYVENTRRQDREHQPGIILFRKSAAVPKPAPRATPAPQVDPYRDALVVFIVGEDATAGIQREQFRNSLKWIERLKQLSPNAIIQILGPHFSGSFPSLEHLLSDDAAGDSKILVPQDGSFLDIFSGNVASETNARGFIQQLIRSHLNINFHSFQAGDVDTTDRFNDYLQSTGIELCHVAIVSEDQTAYGIAGWSGAWKQSGPGTCNFPISFSYPRDISGLRGAYQEQAVLSTRSSSPEAASHRALRGDIADPEGKVTDGIRRYGGDQTALSQEAVLLQLVSMFHRDQIQYIVLRGSNQLDQMFLTRFFKTAYPEGRIVLLGNDLLLRRDIASSGMNGVMTVGAYPLLPEIDHWTAPDPKNWMSQHMHRAFTYETAQGEFTALSFLLGHVEPPVKLPANEQALVKDQKPGPDPDAPCVLDSPSKGIDLDADGTFLPRKNPICDNPKLAHDYLRTPGYGSPFWLRDEPNKRNVPAVWVSILGNDGFWPVATLDGKLLYHPTDPLSPVADAISSIANAMITPLCTFLQVTTCLKSTSYSPDKRYPTSIPFPMAVCLGLVFLWSVAHLYLCARPSVTVKPVYRSYFQRPFVHPKDNKPAARWLTIPRLHMGLILASCFFIVATANVLAWAYGWSSFQAGEPFQQDRALFALGPFAIWIVCAVAIVANVGREFNPNNIPLFERSWRPLLIFTSLTFLFFCLFVVVIDGTLEVQNRTPTYLRAMNLFTGVSPAAPLVLITTGMYGWCWYSLRGLTLLGMGSPPLPSDENLYVYREDPLDKAKTIPHYIFAMLSYTSAGLKIEALCKPLSRRWLEAFSCAFFPLLLAEYLFGSRWTLASFHLVAPIRNTGTLHFAHIICVFATGVISIILVTCVQLIRLWLRLHEMLLFLDKLPLRRTLQCMRGFTWNSIWRLGGNILEFRYRLVYRQFEALTHLGATLQRLPSQQTLATEIESTRAPRQAFSAWYSGHWDDERERDLSALYNAQSAIASVTGRVFSELLLPAWRKEEESLLVLTPTLTEFSDEEGEHMRHLVNQLPAEVRSGEEAFCLLYVGFIQNVIARMRTLALAIACLFVSLALLVPSYPFDPRPLLIGVIIVLFVIIGVVVFMVFSQMSRDATLSHITNTRPGELGADFWLKFVGFGVGPIFGLLATIFPQLSDFFTSWLQPGISSLK